MDVLVKIIIVFGTAIDRALEDYSFMHENLMICFKWQHSKIMRTGDRQCSNEGHILEICFYLSFSDLEGLHDKCLLKNVLKKPVRVRQLIF